MFMIICAFVFSLLFAIAIAIGPGSLPCLTLHYSAGKKGKARKEKKHL